MRYAVCDELKTLFAVVKLRSDILCPLREIVGVVIFVLEEDVWLYLHCFILIFI